MERFLLPCSSLLFLIPSLYGFSTGHPIPAWILLSLTGSSVAYHSTYTPTLYWIDQIALYGTSLSSYVYPYFHDPWVMCFPLFGNLWNYVVYFYGRKTNRLVFHPVKEIGFLWHSTIHIVSSFCYLCILVGLSKRDLGFSTGK